MKVIILASLFVASSAFAAVQYDKTKISCSRDILTKQYDLNGNFEKDLITKDDISVSIRETWTDNDGKEYRLSTFDMLVNGKKAMTGKFMKTLSFLPQNDGSFVEHGDYRQLRIFEEPYTGGTGNQIEEETGSYDSYYRVNGNVKTYFGPAKNGNPEELYSTVTSTVISPALTSEETVYPTPTEYTNDKNKYVTERNIMTCTYEKLP